MPTVLGPTPLGEHTNKANMQGKSTSGGGDSVSPSSRLSIQQKTNHQKHTPKTKTNTPKHLATTASAMNQSFSDTRKERSQNLVFSSGWVRFTLLSSRLLEATLRQSHAGLSNHLTQFPHIYSLSEGLVMGLSHKTKTILNDDGRGEDLGCNPDGK